MYYLRLTDYYEAVRFYFIFRFYSKFHKRRMEELNITGLHHFITLFLTLSCVADLEDVVSYGMPLQAYYFILNGYVNMNK